MPPLLFLVAEDPRAYFSFYGQGARDQREVAVLGLFVHLLAV